MSIFQKSVINKHLKNLDKNRVEAAYQKFRNNYSPAKIEKIKQLKEETKFHEQEISDKLYTDYSDFKIELFENLIENNPENDKLTLFKKSQKLLDRFLFILFAEDSGLLPPNSISRIIDTYHKLEELDAYKPIYDIYKQYFGYLNIGRKGKTNVDDIPAYNGGLFYSDVLLDNLKIDDEILINDLLKLSEYDFNTEVDVNILGHIFEHSLSNIEEITSEIEGTTIDKSKNKRKKDGVFYTPKYITQYIVENTIGTLCNEKRKELEMEEIEFDGTYQSNNGKLSVKGKKLFQKLNDYKEWLLSLKIIDPACGSGAFLNQALNFLIQEHKVIDDIISELTNSALRLFDTEKPILENNLYGVDINEESVEIAKLSLWLRTAHKGRKLSTLNNNIKCGNSLIDDPEIANDKAFDWNVEFKEIMQNGGFDCVIGNPPYLNMTKDRQIRKILSSNNSVVSKYESHDFPVISELCDLFKGMVVKNRSEFIHAEQSNYSNVFLLGNCIDRYVLKNQFYCNYDEFTIVGGTKKIEKHSISPRILIRRTGNFLCCVMLDKPALTESTLYSCSVRSDNITLDYLLSLLNSKMLTYIVRQKMITNEQAFPQIMMTDIQLLKIPIATIDIQDKLGKCSIKIFSISQQLQQKKNKFLNRVKDNFKIEKTSNKIGAFYNYDFKTFIAELKKQKIKLTLNQQDEWEDYFNSYKNEINQLQAEINRTDKEIEQMVYALYELTEEEIRIVEKSF